MHGQLNVRVLRSSGMLRSVDRYLSTDVSGHPLSLSRLQGSGSRTFTLEDGALEWALEGWALQDGNDRLSRNFGK